MKKENLKNNISWIGSIDSDLKVFDVIMETEFGTSYNSYLIKGSEKTAIVETVKVKFFDEYIAKLKEEIDLNKLDYIIVNHTEPDHAGSIEKLLDYAPNAKIIGSKVAISYLKEITNKKFDAIIANDDLKLSLGDKTLKFLNAPFLHWPDSMYTYIIEDKVLLTCDSFGSHYATEKVLFSKMTKEEYPNFLKALKYYYDVIFSPFKKHILKALDKIEKLDIEMILTGHGPVLDVNFDWILEKYKEWSTEEIRNNNKKQVVIPYVSAYGYTKESANIIKDELIKNDIEVKMHELDISNYGSIKNALLADITVADGILIGSTTINGDAVPIIWDFLVNLSPLTCAGKKAGVFGSYGWSGEGIKNVADRLKQLRFKMLDETFKFKFKLSETEKAEAVKFASEFAAKIK